MTKESRYYTTSDYNRIKISKEIAIKEYDMRNGLNAEFRALPIKILPGEEGELTLIIEQESRNVRRSQNCVVREEEGRHIIYEGLNSLNEELGYKILDIKEGKFPECKILTPRQNTIRFEMYKRD